MLGYLSENVHLEEREGDGRITLRCEAGSEWTWLRIVPNY
jgi:hypothetical protein